MSGIAGIAGFSSPYSYFSQPINGKLEVPVSPSESLYAQFKYVRGVATEDGGLSIDRIKVIDSLLSQINSHRQQSSAPLKREDLDLSKPDEAIQKLSQQAFVMQAQAPDFQNWGHVSGLVFDVKA